MQKEILCLRLHKPNQCLDSSLIFFRLNILFQSTAVNLFLQFKEQTHIGKTMDITRNKLPSKINLVQVGV